jgi:site-specific recombinase XerD
MACGNRSSEDGNNVSVPLPPDVAQEVLAVFKANSNPRYAFWTGLGEKRMQSVIGRTISGNCSETLASITRQRARWSATALRDTFAVDLLEKGVPLEEVSKLLGHESLKTTEKHYNQVGQGEPGPA